MPFEPPALLCDFLTVFALIASTFCDLLVASVPSVDASLQVTMVDLHEHLVGTQLYLAGAPSSHPGRPVFLREQSCLVVQGGMDRGGNEQQFLSCAGRHKQNGKDKVCSLPLTITGTVKRLHPCN